MRAVEAGVPSEYADAVRQIKAAREVDVLERALSAAREELGMDAAYIATVDSQEQTIEAMVGRTNSDVLVPGACTAACAARATSPAPDSASPSSASCRFSPGSWLPASSARTEA